MQRFWNRLDERMQENASGILGTLAFHMVLIVIFLIMKISAEKTRLENIIVVDFQDEAVQDEPEPEKKSDPEFEKRLASYLKEARSNVPVNVARQVEQKISTENYVKELENELDAKRPEDRQKIKDRLEELKELNKEEISMEAHDTTEKMAKPYEGPTNIFYDLQGRHHIQLYVPVYKCEGSGMVEVKIAVDQSGRVVQAETEKPGDTVNDICLQEAARNAAMKSRFNADFSAPVRQTGTITYHFIAQ